ncbi:MAG: M48 family metalloprotease [Ilumatobacteraceae bacterium]
MARTPTTDGRGRQVDRSAVTALVPVAAIVPFWLLALAVPWLVARMLTDVRFWVLPAAWIGLGVLLFVPAVQVAVLSPVLGARRMLAHEADRIEPVWNEVISRVGLRRHRYTIRIIDSTELNAFACGGHLLIVTSFALEQLSPRQLAGVLAHELSHHLGLHTAALTVGHWLSLPVVLLARIGFFLQNVARAATDSFAAASTLLTVVGRLLTLALRAASWMFLAALFASDALANLVGRASEFEADRRVVRLGYGRHLAEALRVVIHLGGGARAIGWRARLAASHPPARTRVARIEAMMRHPSR